MTRDERQDQFIDKFIAAGGCGTLEAATAFGKTRVALKIIRYLRRSDKKRVVRIIVPHEHLKTQWEKLLKEWKIEQGTSVHIINSYVKGLWECSLLILDECHRYAADTFSKVFECTKYRFILGLTASMKRLDRKHTIVTKMCPIIDKVTIEEARINGYIAPYQEFNLGIEMDPLTAENYAKAEDYFNHAMGVFQWDFSILKRCLVSHKPGYNGFSYRGSACEELARSYGWKGNSPREAYIKMMKGEPNIWEGNMTHPYHPDKLSMKAINGIRSMRKMKDIIDNYEGKLLAAVEILNALPEMKAITFAQLTNTADEMAKRTPMSAAYHSSMTVYDKKGKKLPKKKAREYIISQINEGKIKRIHTAKALDEGADFPSISLGIRISGTSSPTQQTQRRGRIVRKHEDKEAVMINLYLKNTKEVKWLSKSQGFSSDILWVDDINEIIETINE